MNPMKRVIANSTEEQLLDALENSFRNMESFVEQKGFETIGAACIRPCGWVYFLLKGNIEVGLFRKRLASRFIIASNFALRDHTKVEVHHIMDVVEQEAGKTFVSFVNGDVLKYCNVMYGRSYSDI